MTLAKYAAFFAYLAIGPSHALAQQATCLSDKNWPYATSRIGATKFIKVKDGDLNKSLYLIPDTHEPVFRMKTEKTIEDLARAGKIQGVIFESLPWLPNGLTYGAEIVKSKSLADVVKGRDIKFYGSMKIQTYNDAAEAMKAYTKLPAVLQFYETLSLIKQMDSIAGASRPKNAAAFEKEFSQTAARYESEIRLYLKNNPGATLSEAEVMEKVMGKREVITREVIIDALKTNSGVVVRYGANHIDNFILPFCGSNYTIFVADMASHKEKSPSPKPKDPTRLSKDTLIDPEFIELHDVIGKMQIFAKESFAEMGQKIK